MSVTRLAFTYPVNEEIRGKRKRKRVVKNKWERVRANQKRLEERKRVK